MGKKQPDLPPPGAVDALLTRIEGLEQRIEALEAAARAFAVVYAIPRLPDNPGGRDEQKDNRHPIDE